MSNGVPPCCPLEICCDAAQRRIKVVASLAEFTHAEPEYCEKFLDWMDEKKLVFAPASFQQVITEIAQMAKAHAKD